MDIPDEAMTQFQQARGENRAVRLRCGDLALDAGLNFVYGGGWTTFQFADTAALWAWLDRVATRWRAQVLEDTLPVATGMRPRGRV